MVLESGGCESGDRSAADTVQCGRWRLLAGAARGAGANAALTKPGQRVRTTKNSRWIAFTWAVQKQHRPWQGDARPTHELAAEQRRRAAVAAASAHPLAVRTHGTGLQLSL